MKTLFGRFEVPVVISLRSRFSGRSALALALALIVLTGTGCMKWVAHGGEGIIPSNIRNSAGEHLRITRTDSSRLKLRRVAVSGDTLFGTRLGMDTGFPSPTP